MDYETARINKLTAQLDKIKKMRRNEILEAFNKKRNEDTTNTRQMEDRIQGD